MRKCSKTIHISFWALAAFFILAASLSLFFKDNGLDFLFSNNEIGEFAGSEEVVIKEAVEVEKEVEWYYFIASGYSANDPVQGTNNITATGKEIKQGMVAVDPEVIPLGTKIEIKEMGIFVAEDTGGKIKGNRIDVYFDSKEEAKKFGKRGIWIKIADGGYKLADLSDNEQYISRYMNR